MPDPLTSYEAETILGMLRSFARLDRPATDEIGWVALKLNCTRGQAAQKIKAARAMDARKK